MSSRDTLQIGQIGIPITDLDKAISFYENTLELPLLFKSPPGLAFFKCGEIRLMLDSSSKENAGRGTVIYFAVKDLNDWYEIRVYRGIKFEREPHLVARMQDHELWMCFIRDPDGNIIGIMEEKK